MAQRKFKTSDVIIIVLFFLLYMIGYAWLIPRNAFIYALCRVNSPKLLSKVNLFS